jgi:hypothetical protein
MNRFVGIIELPIPLPVKGSWYYVTAPKAEEALQLFEIALNKRREYLRRKLKLLSTLPKHMHGGGRRERGEMMRGGMLSEI